MNTKPYQRARRLLSSEKLDARKTRAYPLALCVILSILTANLSLAQAPTNGLVARYLFSGSGSNSFGKGNAATVAGNSSYLPGGGVRIIGDTGERTSGGGYIELPVSTYGLSNQFTFNLVVSNVSQAKFWGEFLVFWGIDSPDRPSVRIDAKPLTGWNYGVFGPRSPEYIQFDVLPTNHNFSLSTDIYATVDASFFNGIRTITAVKSATNISLYIDGALWGQKTNTAPLPSESVMHIGKHTWIPSGGGTSTALIASIYKFEAYNRALSPTEVAALFSGQNSEVDSDGDGLKDKVEILLQNIGFDPNVSDAAKVISLFVNPNNAFLYTQAQFNANRTNGRTDVTTSPATFNLFTQSQREDYGTLQFGKGQSSVTTNPAAFNLYTQAQFNANRTNGILSVLGMMPSIELSVPSSALLRAGLGSTNITAVTASMLPPGWQFDPSAQEIYGRVQGTNLVSALVLGLRPTGETMPIALNFTPVASEITSINMPLSSRIQAGKTAKIPLNVWNNSPSAKNVTVEFASSDESKLATPAPITIYVPGKNVSSGKPGRATRVVNVTAGSNAGEVELVASVGNVSSAPCAVTIKAPNVRL